MLGYSWNLIRAVPKDIPAPDPGRMADTTVALPMLNEGLYSYPEQGHERDIPSCLTQAIQRVSFESDPGHNSVTL